MWTPYFARCVTIRWRDSFFYLFGKNLIFFLFKKKKKNLKSSLIFIFIFFKGKQNKKKKNLSVTPYLEKTVYGKSKSGPRIRSPIGKVWW